MKPGIVVDIPGFRRLELRTMVSDLPGRFHVAARSLTESSDDWRFHCEIRIDHAEGRTCAFSRDCS
jgi:hypothetical protein